MKTRNLFLTFLLFAALGFAAGDDCVVQSLEGGVQIREPFQNDWVRAKKGIVLKDHSTIRSQSNGRARIRTYSGEPFVLPPEAQIEVSDLRQLSREDLMMELTAIEMQKLPEQNQETKAETALVLHGAVHETRDLEAIRKEFVELETNGALSLFHQGFISGFIVKANRLMVQFPEENFLDLAAELIQAYDAMKMPSRKQAFIDRINRTGVLHNEE